MNWLDIAILVVVAVSTFLGLLVGLIGAALSLAGIIIGVILAGRYYAPFSQLLSFIPGEGVAEVVAFVIILIGVMAIAFLLTVLLKWAFSLVKLGWVNSIGGAFFGLVLGVIFCGALLAMWAKFLGVGGAITGSVLAPILLDRVPLVLALLPAEFDAVRSFFQ